VSDWADQDLTALTGGPQAAKGDALSNFSDSKGEHALYVGKGHDVRHLFYNGQVWVDRDLTKRASAPQAANGSRLWSFADSAGEHVYYVADGQNIHQLFFDHKNWVDLDLTALSDGPKPANGSGLCSFADSMGEHVFYLGADQHLHHLYFFDNEDWLDQSLTTLTRGPQPANGSGLCGFADSAGEHVFYISAGDQHVHQLYFNWNEWIDQDLTVLSNGPSAANGSGLCSFRSRMGDELLLFYVDANQRVHLLRFYKVWDHEAVTSSGPPVAPVATGSALSGCLYDNAWWVFYVGTDRHVHANVVYSGPNWHDLDLTSLTGGPQAPSGIGLSSFADEKGVHLYYVGDDQHVHCLSKGLFAARSRELRDVVPEISSMPGLDTELLGYDALVAITQKTINTQFGYLWRLNVIKHEIDLAVVTHNNDNTTTTWGTLKAQMGAPTVVINTGERQQVFFILHFGSGTFDTWSGVGPTAKKITIPFGAGSLGFKVTLGYAGADAEKVPEAVKAALRRLNLGSGMFSMRQLFLDLENANLAELDAKYTSLPAELTGNVYFKQALDEMFAEMHRNGGNILGYGITVKNPNQVNQECPTLPPTDLTFATHTYQAQGTGTTTPDLDTLNYLMMTKRRERPHNVWPSGNFVNVSGIDGVMAIAKSTFLDGYLIPRLASVITLKTTLVQSGDRSVRLMTQSNGGPLTPNGSSWTYEDNPRLTVGSHEGPLNTFPSNLTWEVHHGCTVTVLPGTNMVKITGRSSLFHKVEAWAGIKHHALSESVWFVAQSNWSIEIAFGSIDRTGALRATVTSTIPEPMVGQGGDFIGSLERYVNPNVGGQLQSILATLRKLVDRANLEQAVGNVLANQNGFIFPGGQQFSFKDAIFNTEQDLLATVTINFY
jgi:hypothetical protein